MTYLVDCWIQPRSGFDVREHNLMLSFFRDLFSSFDAENGTDMSDVIDVLDKKYEGMVIHTFTIESNEKSLDLERDLLPQIRKEHPEAELITCTCLPKKG